MDKRSILFLLCVFFSLSVMNAYFNYEHEQKLQEWRTLHEKKLEEKAALAQEEALAPEPEGFSPLPVPESQGPVEQQFYVLENAYQQLVFSNFGGALAEINLPFVSKDNEKSIVREIEFDRTIQDKGLAIGNFPAAAYRRPGVEDLQSPSMGGYYPLLRRGAFDSISQRYVHPHPSQYCLNVLSDHPETAELVYQLKHFDRRSIVFESVQSYRRITKTYELPAEDSPAPYYFDVTVKVEKSRGDRQALWLTTGTPEVEMTSGVSSPILRARVSKHGKPEVEKLDLPSSQTVVSSVQPDWICNSNGFLGFILDPLTPIAQGYKVQLSNGNVLPSRLVSIDPLIYKANDFPGYNMMLPLLPDGGTMHFRFYAGPLAEAPLKAIDRAFTHAETGKHPDYSSTQTYHGWFSFISQPFARFLFMLMKFFYSVTHSWALSIVLLTLSLRVMLYPLNAWSMKAMRRAQQVQPQIAALQAKYKNDPQKMQMEVMNLYRKSGGNPLTGCLPMLIQMPFLIGMFDLLKSAFELRGAVFIPGWIDNLTAPDVLFDWGFHIFFIGSQLHVLPLMLGSLMYFQQKMTTELPKDPSQWTEQDHQKSTMMKVMPVVLTFVFYSFPSGLNIYWLSSTLLGMLQQWLTNKQLEKEKLPVEVPVPLGKKKSRKNGK